MIEKNQSDEVTSSASIRKATPIFATLISMEAPTARSRDIAICRSPFTMLATSRDPYKKG